MSVTSLSVARDEMRLLSELCFFDPLHLELLKAPLDFAKGRLSFQYIFMQCDMGGLLLM
jgi:hypothetical protein